MNHAKYNDSCRKLFLSSNIITVCGLYIIEISKFYIKHREEIRQSQHSHIYSTRNKNKIQHEIHRTKLYENSPYYMCGKIINTLSSKYNLTIEKKRDIEKIKSMLRETPLYTLEEFF